MQLQGFFVLLVKLFSLVDLLLFMLLTLSFLPCPYR